MPYGADMVAKWIDDYSRLLREVEESKNPADPAGLDDAGRARLERSRQAYPETFRATEGQVLSPFPILVDADRTLSQGLGFFTTDWSGSSAEQNIPTVLVIDPDGVLQFKYMSQNTLDRPPLEYLVQVVDLLNGLGG